MRGSSPIVLGAWHGVPGKPFPPRELECVLYLANGHTYKTTARALGLSPATISKSLRRAMDRLFVANGKQLIAEAVRSGAICAF